PADRGWLPHPVDGREHRRGDRAAPGRARASRQPLRPAAGTAEGARSVKRAWLWYLCVTGGLTLLYLFFPPLAGNGPLITALGLSGVVAIVVGILINKPKARLAWWLFAAGQFLYF